MFIIYKHTNFINIGIQMLIINKYKISIIYIEKIFNIYKYTSIICKYAMFILLSIDIKYLLSMNIQHLLSIIKQGLLSIKVQ